MKLSEANGKVVMLGVNQMHYPGRICYRVKVTDTSLFAELIPVVWIDDGWKESRIGRDLHRTPTTECTEC